MAKASKEAVSCPQSAKFPLVPLSKPKKSAGAGIAWAPAAGKGNTPNTAGTAAAQEDWRNMDSLRKARWAVEGRKIRKR